MNTQNWTKYKNIQTNVIFIAVLIKAIEPDSVKAAEENRETTGLAKIIPVDENVEAFDFSEKIINEMQAKVGGYLAAIDQYEDSAVVPILNFFTKEEFEGLFQAHNIDTNDPDKNVVAETDEILSNTNCEYGKSVTKTPFYINYHDSIGSTIESIGNFVQANGIKYAKLPFWFTSSEDKLNLNKDIPDELKEEIGVVEYLKINGADPKVGSLSKIDFLEHPAGISVNINDTKPEELNIGFIAKMCHEVNKAYCEHLGDDSQVSFEEAPDWQVQSAIKGVQFRIDNPDAPASAQHDSWMQEKLADGWKYGEKKDSEKKEHHCLVDYDELPAEQRAKGAIFVTIIKTFVSNLKI